MPYNLLTVFPIKLNQAKSSQIKVGSVIILAVLMTQNGK